MKRSILLSFLLVLGLVSHAFAGNLAGPPGSGVRVYVPDGWKTTTTGTDKDGVLLAMEPREEAMLMYALADAKDLAKAVKGLDAFLGKFITGGKMTKAGKIKLNGMNALASKGTGKVEGKTVAIAVFIVETPTGKALFTVGIVDDAKKDAYKATLDQVIAGLRPAS